MSPRRTTGPADVVVAYIRVSTAEQADSGAGLAAQRATIEAEVTRRSWTLLEVYEDAGASGSTVNGRPGLAQALEALESGRAGTLVAAKVDRLSRSLRDFADLMHRADTRGWNLVALDLGVDTTTPSGGFMASVIAASAEYERRLIGQRTRDALAARKAAGVRLGRPQNLSTDVVRLIVDARTAGDSLRAIANQLTSNAVATAHGGSRWHASTVAAVLRSQAAAGIG
jgi:DNA invertase Pin-like site-specific DNA recombinase